MRFVKVFLLATVAICVLSIALIAQNKPRDSYGRVDKAEVVVTQVKPNHFSLDLLWENDQKMAAFTYPLIVRGDGFTLHYDSVQWSPRISYFAVKSVRPIDSLQQVLVGFFADLDGTKEPLAEGKGSVATLYFTAAGKGKIDVCGVSIDSTFIGPSSTLYGVTPDAVGTIHPIFVVSKRGADGKPADCK